MWFRPEIASPSHVARLTAIGIAFAGAGLFAIAKPALQTPAPQRTAIEAPVEVPEIALDVPVSSQTDAPPVARMGSRSVAMVFTAQGATWMKLENLRVLGEATDMDGVPRSAFPKHGVIRHTQEDYVEIATAPIALEDVPAAHRDRLGDKIIVDGTCTTYITGFAVVARLTGSTGYAGDDTSDGWTGTSVMKYGAPMIAAKLGDCTGTLARDATLPPAIEARAQKDDDAKLVARAKQMLLRSADAKATTKEWDGFYANNEFSKDESRGHWSTDSSTTWQTMTFVHPTTHETWISIHANQLEGCGSPHVNVWGLYRVEADGTLTAFEAKLGDIETIDQLIDLDGDGVVEVVGKEWLGDTLVNDHLGNTLEKLDRPFYGCPC
ncbi:MAG: hypothetical protein AB7T06_40665 [Kofleriaceae bacterium]